MLHKNVNVAVRARHSEGKKRYFIPVHAKSIQGKKEVPLFFTSALYTGE
jgi:hypothetical protein